MAKDIDVNSIKVDFVLVSHAHFDHTADTEAIARNNNAVVVSSYEIAMHYGAKGLKHHPMNAGGKWDFGKWNLKCVQAVHSSVFADGSAGGNALGFAVSGGGKTFYYSGDTALHLDMELVGRQHKLDHAFLSIGDNFTMGYEDALIAADMIKCDNIVGMHFDTFPYIRLDHNKVKQHFAEAGKQLRLPAIGESWTI